MDDNRMILRLHLQVPNASAAAGVLDAIAPELASCGQIICSSAEKYWEIDGYFAVFLELEPADRVLEAFHQVMDALGTGWDKHHFNDGGDWAVWNPGPCSHFLFSEVRWANLECIRPN